MEARVKLMFLHPTVIQKERVCSILHVRRFLVNSLSSTPKKLLKENVKVYLSSMLHFLTVNHV